MTDLLLKAPDGRQVPFPLEQLVVQDEELGLGTELFGQGGNFILDGGQPGIETEASLEK